MVFFLHPARLELTLTDKASENGLFWDLDSSGIRKLFSFTLAKSSCSWLVHTSSQGCLIAQERDVLLSLLGARPVSCALQALGVRWGRGGAPGAPVLGAGRGAGHHCSGLLLAFLALDGVTNESAAVLGSSGRRGLPWWLTR